jgi:hypothetical protein
MVFWNPTDVPIVMRQYKPQQNCQNALGNFRVAMGWLSLNSPAFTEKEK